MITFYIKAVELKKNVFPIFIRDHKKYLYGRTQDISLLNVRDRFMKLLSRSLKSIGFRLG